MAGSVLFVTGGRAWLGALVPQDVPGRSAIAASFLGVGFSPAPDRGGVYMIRMGLALVDSFCSMCVACGRSWLGALVPQDVPGRSAIAASFLGVGLSPVSVRGGGFYRIRIGLALVFIGFALYCVRRRRSVVIGGVGPTRRAWAVGHCG